MLQYIKRLFCHHEWGPSRSEPNTIICWKCKTRRSV